MSALMPRYTECVLCGEPIQGKGRIDRIYCSASCRTLAWRARAGHRFEGSRKPKMPPQPGDFIARKALPLLAVRMRTELAAAKRRIAELEKRLTEQRGGAGPVATKIAVGIAAAVGAIGLAAALRRRRHRRQRAEAELTRDVDVVEAERQRHRAEIIAERQRAAHREAELLEQVTILMTRIEQAEAREQAAVASLSPVKQDIEVLRHELNQNADSARKMRSDMAALQGTLSEANKQLCRQSEALLRESQQRHHLQLQLNEVRRYCRVQQQELEATDATLTDESRQLERLQSQLMAVQRQLVAERRQWQDARALLARHAQREQRRLLADNDQLRNLLAERESRPQVAIGTITEYQNETEIEKLRYLERMEESQRKKLVDSQEEPKQLSGTKEQKQISATSGLSKKVLLTTLRAVKRAAADTPRPDLKRLPPKRG